MRSAVFCAGWWSCANDQSGEWPLVASNNDTPAEHGESCAARSAGGCLVRARPRIKRSVLSRRGHKDSSERSICRSYRAESGDRAHWRERRRRSHQTPPVTFRPWFFPCRGLRRGAGALPWRILPDDVSEPLRAGISRRSWPPSSAS